jgi:hypothetical protein
VEPRKNAESAKEGKKMGAKILEQEGQRATEGKIKPTLKVRQVRDWLRFGRFHWREFGFLFEIKRLAITKIETHPKNQIAIDLPLISTWL